MQAETLCESHGLLPNVNINGERVGQPDEDIIFNENEISINPDDVTLNSAVKIQPMNLSYETILTESNEKLVVESRAGNAGIEFDEHVVTVSSEPVFMGESLEREAANGPTLEFRLRLDSDTEDEEEERILPFKECFSPAPPENAGIELVTGDEHAVTVLSEAVLTRESDEEFAVEPCPENVSNEFDEHVVTVSSEAVFMCESLERETNNEPDLQFHLQLDSEDDERILPFKEPSSPAPSEILVPDANEFHMKLRRRAIVEHDCIPSSSCAEIILAKAKGERQSKKTEPAERCELGETDVKRILRKRIGQVATNTPKRAKETPEQRKARLAYHTEYWKRRIANETAEQRKTRLARKAENRQKSIANETVKQRKARLAAAAERERKKKANETAEQKKARLARKAEQRKARLAYHTEYWRRRIANETAEQRKTRLAKKAEYRKQIIANKTVKQSNARLASREKKAVKMPAQLKKHVAERMRQRRLCQTPQREEHYEGHVERTKRIPRKRIVQVSANPLKAKETSAQRKTRSACRTEYMRQEITSETPEQREELIAGHVARTRRERSAEREKRLSRANTMP